MGIMDKIKRATGADEQYDDIYDNEYYDGFDSYGDDIDGAPTQNVNIGADAAYSTAGGIGGSTYGAPAASGYASAGGISLSGNAIELKVVKPEHFESVTQIADHLLKKRTIVLNLENTNKETARRLIDFLSGVAYSIEGSLKKIASNAYVITPANVDVGDAQLRSRATVAAKEEGAEAEESAPAAEF
jgi:cell division inhibitor SepF